LSPKIAIQSELRNTESISDQTKPLGPRHEVEQPMKLKFVKQNKDVFVENLDSHSQNSGKETLVQAG
jgi:hypothetical protein